MSSFSSSTSEFRFGPFEFSAQLGELRKAGTRLKLQPQPARLLLLLVSSRGEIVNREQIQQFVWGADVTVDYDLGVNRCIRQIRSALLDDAESPRYIRTIPRLGYCFIAPVDLIVREPASSSLPIPTEAESSVGKTPVRPIDSIEFPAQPASANSVFPKNAARLVLQLQAIVFLLAVALVAIGISQYLLRPSLIPSIESYSQLTTDSYQKVIQTGDLARPISTDGSRVYFSVLTGAARSAIAQVAEAGGETSLLPISLESPILLDLFKPRSELLLASGTGMGELPLWIQPLPSGSAHSISDLSAQGGSWSPDGTQMVYASTNRLYLASGSGMNSKLLATFDARRGQRAYWPRWSPDGKCIRFSLYDSTRHASSLWEIDANGRLPRRLLPDWNANPDICCGTWTPDSRYYVFVCSVGDRSDLWALATRAGDLMAKWRPPVKPSQLTAGPYSYSGPTFSSDGKKLFTIGSAPRGELVRYDSASGHLLPLTPEIPARQADFSRDGKWIAFVSLDGTLWCAKSDATVRRQLSFPPLRTALPRWSPDRTSVAFFGRSSNESDAIYLVTAYGGLPRKLVSEKNHDEKDPDWSADGRQLVFSDTSADGSSLIKILNLQSGRVSRLASPFALRSPRWSPDGRYISALTRDLRRLMLYDFATRTWTQLADFRMGYPNWSHNSQYLYVVNLSQGSTVCRVRVSDHAVEPVLNMADRNQYWTGDAWLGLTPEDSPLLSRDISIQQLFVLHWTNR